MANVTIAQLPVAGALTGTELVPVVQNGNTVQTTTGQIQATSNLSTYSFVTVNATPALGSSRYLATGTGLGLTDNGAGNSYQISLNGTSGSLESAGFGMISKTSSGTVVNRTISVSGTGLQITNGNGISGNPTISVTGTLATIAALSGTGLVILNGSTFATQTLQGTSGQIAIANANGVSGTPTFSLVTTAVTAGTYTAPTITVDAYGRITSASSNTLNTGTVTNINSGAGLTGGPITTTGTLSLATVGTAGTYGSASTIPQITTNAYGQITSVTNNSVSISASAISSGTLSTAYGGTNSSSSPTAGSVIYGTGTAYGVSSVGVTGQLLTSQGSSPPIWTTVSGAGTVTTVSVVSANGFAGTVANPNVSPAITLSTTVTGVLKGNGTAISAAVSGTDYAPATSGTSILYGNGSGGFSNVTIGSGLSFSTGTLSATSGSGTVTSVSFTGGLISVATATTTPALTVAGTSGGIVYFSSASTWASSAVLSANALMIGGGAGNAPSTITTGTGVVTALGVNTGSAGAFVVNGGALGTPSSGTLTNATGLPISTGVSGLGTGVATALAVNTGSSGSFVVNGGALGTPSSGTLTNATGLPISTGVSGLGTGVATALAVNTGSAGAFVVNGGALGTPSSGTVTNLTGTASININGTVGATTPTTGAFTTVSASGQITSTVSTGTAPFVVSSTTQVANLNAATAGTAGSVTNSLTAGTGISYSSGTTYNGSSAITINNSGVTSFSAGTTGFTPSTTTTGAITLSGTLNVSNGGTGLTSLTANYVPYGNGTSAYQSSANLTFNGTTLTLGNAGVSARFQGDFSNATFSSRTAFQTGTSNGTTGIYALPNGTSTAASWQATNNSDPTNASKILIATNGSTDVQLVSGINGTGTYLPLSFYTNGSQQMRLDTSGNLGLGVTPSAWTTSYKAIQIGRAGAFWAGASGNDIYMSSNFYYDGTNNKYITTNYASYFSQTGGGAFTWSIAPSGTAGTNATFTQAMTLSAAGGLSVGTTADSGAGAIYATGNITAYYSSDIKFKTNVQDIQDPLGIVTAIGSKTFDWTDEYLADHGGEDEYFQPKQSFGVIAQDVQKVFPQAVRTRTDGSLAVDYEKLAILSFGAIGQLLKRIEALESR